MAIADGMAATNLSDLRQGALRSVLLGLLAGLYLWVGALYLSSEGFSVGFAAPAWAAAGCAVAMVSRKRRPSLAAAALVGGLALSILCAVWVSGVRLAPHFLATVVALAGLFYGLEVVLSVTIACCAAVMLIGTLRFELAPFSGDLLAPVLVVGTVGILSALAVRNLYIALYWAWDRTMAAQRNERELRERRAELARTAKALDEACRRLEYLNYDLARAREVAEEARLLKQQFTTNVSHELRTPLNVIVAFAEMMYLSPQSYGGVPLPPEYLGDVREIYQASQSLLRLIDDVLDLSQIEAQRLRLRLEPGDAGEVIAEALEIIRPLVRGTSAASSISLPRT
ncbi:MAG: histidine kinase dimerization/phospho-acceptor domain-containing protein, partial [Anaerolineae bacterium]|nr:histidine kinase dimerization/phospho-acceptor domain-containing protein [Anaerolineae bacterium]